MQEDFENFKKKQRYEQAAKGGGDDIRGELMVERQQNNNLRAQIENMEEELEELRRQLKDTERLKRDRDQQVNSQHSHNSGPRRGQPNREENNENIYAREPRRAGARGGYDREGDQDD